MNIEFQAYPAENQSTSPTNIMITRISLFPTRLRPIFYATNTSIIIIDFVTGRLINFNEIIIPEIYAQSPVYFAIHRLTDTITISVHREEVSHSYKINSEIPMFQYLAEGSLSEDESFDGIRYNDGSVKEITWEDATLDIWDPIRLTLTPKYHQRMPGIFIAHDKLRLIKLHPRSNDSSGLYKKYFCLHYSNCLSIGTIRNEKIHAKKITHPLFGHIFRFCLMEDNILMLAILKEVFREGYYQQLMFIDCNKIKIICSIELDKNIAPPISQAHIFTTLTPTRKDYDLLQSKFIPSITPFLIPPLASIVFSYLFGAIP